MIAEKTMNIKFFRFHEREKLGSFILKLNLLKSSFVRLRIHDKATK